MKEDIQAWNQELKAKEYAEKHIQVIQVCFRAVRVPRLIWTANMVLLYFGISSVLLLAFIFTIGNPLPSPTPCSGGEVAGCIQHLLCSGLTSLARGLLGQAEAFIWADICGFQPRERITVWYLLKFTVSGCRQVISSLLTHNFIILYLYFPG